MIRKNPTQNRLKLSLIASFIVVFTAPLVLWGLVNIDSLDTSSQASTSQNEIIKCRVKFLYVDPNSIEADKTITLKVIANSPDEQIKNIAIWVNEQSETLTEDTKVIFEKDFSSQVNSEITDEQLSYLSSYEEKFYYLPEDTGLYSLGGTLTTQKDGVERNYPCFLEGGSLPEARIEDNNEAPEFTTTVPTTTQNSLKVGDQYKYDIQVVDKDSASSFGYAYSFTPNAEWLEADISKNVDKKNVTLDVKLNGVADYPASYLVNLLVWDGYNDHTRSQSWIISVDQKENDIPKVNVSMPVEGTVIKIGNTIEIKWEVTDLNHIDNFEIYLTSNLENKNSWIKIDDTIDYNVGRYLLDSSGFKEGEYYIVVLATDNYKPPLTGTGYSGKFSLSTSQENILQPSDDGNQNTQAQIAEISPEDQSVISNKRPIIRATLTAQQGATIVEDSISMSIDDVSVTDKITLTKINEGEISINYIPEKDLDAGTHKVKVGFTDTNGNKVEKQWIFTIEKDIDNGKLINIFGVQLTLKQLIIYCLIALGIIVLVILIPWILYWAFRGPKKKGYDIYPTYVESDRDKEYVTYINGKAQSNYGTDKNVFVPATTLPDEKEENLITEVQTDTTVISDDELKETDTDTEKVSVISDGDNVKDTLLVSSVVPVNEADKESIEQNKDTTKQDISYTEKGSEEKEDELVDYEKYLTEQNGELPDAFRKDYTVKDAEVADKTITQTETQLPAEKVTTDEEEAKQIPEAYPSVLPVVIPDTQTEPQIQPSESSQVVSTTPLQQSEDTDNEVGWNLKERNIKDASEPSDIPIELIQKNVAESPSQAPITSPDSSLQSIPITSTELDKQAVEDNAEPNLIATTQDTIKPETINGTDQSEEIEDFTTEVVEEVPDETVNQLAELADMLKSEQQQDTDQQQWDSPAFSDLPSPDSDDSKNINSQNNSNDVSTFSNTPTVIPSNTKNDLNDMQPATSIISNIPNEIKSDHLISKEIKSNQDLQIKADYQKTNVNSEDSNILSQTSISQQNPLPEIENLSSDQVNLIPQVVPSANKDTDTSIISEPPQIIDNSSTSGYNSPQGINDGDIMQDETESPELPTIAVGTDISNQKPQ